MSKKSTGLGKGLDSLIPNYYDEEFDSNNSLSLEDMLNDDENNIEEEIKKIEKNEKEIKMKDDENEEKRHSKISNKSDIVKENNQENKKTLTNKEIENINEVKEIVSKNPRITLWSSQSACVFRYLRKTEPEFSISKEASILIDEAISKKYPDIWKLFEDS